MLRWLLALLLIPLLDSVLLALVVVRFGLLGWVQMVLLVVLTGLVGMLLVRAEGRRTIRKIQRSLSEGRPPTNELLDGALLIAAGAFLLTPGFVTDVLGFLLVLPLTRIPIRAGLKRFVVVPYLDSKADGFATGKVWTFGFPDSQGGAGGPRDADGSTDGGTINLGANDYSVDEGDDDDAGTDGYTIEFEDDDEDDVDAR